MIRTIIIDDEPSALNVLSMMLKKKCKEDIEIVGTTNSPLAGKMLIEEQQPDLVFLDIEMPGMSGVDLVRSFENPSFRVVFVTAYDDYAVEAFRLSAVDYLLKPVGAEDVINAVQKIKEDIQKKQNPLNDQLQYLEKLFSKHSDNRNNKIGIGMIDKILFVNIKDILYCEASGSYTHVFLADGQKLMSSKALGEFESQLTGSDFFRIHHHYLINMDRIKEYKRNDGGYVIMENGKKLEVSQRKKKDFIEAIQDRVV